MSVRKLGHEVTVRPRTTARLDEHPPAVTEDERDDEDDEADDETAERLARTAAAGDRSQSSVVRRALREHLGPRQSPRTRI
jgi:hypothetical protein